MLGIPPAKDSDAEDVVWGLQTAEALWKRGERLDALVWLRRAAQAAGDAADDDRALELARFAAELSESMATVVPPSTSAAPPAPSFPPVPPAVRAVPTDYDVMTTRPYASDIPPPRVEPPPAHPPSSPTMQTADPTFAEEAPLGAPSERGSTSVPPAEMVHAGMYNPWDEGSVVTAAATPEARPANVSALEPEAPEEVVTSVRGQKLADQLANAQAPATTAARSVPPRPGGPPKPGKPPPLPPRALKGKAPAAPAPVGPAPPLPSSPGMRIGAPRSPFSEPPLPSEAPPAPATDPSAPPSDPADIDDHTPVHPYDVRDIAAASGRPPPPTPAPPSPTQVTDPAVLAAAAAKSTGGAMQAPEKLDLEGVDSFSDLPDDARAAFAAAAKVSSLAEGEEVSSFALAYVLEGTCDIAATMVDAPALRLAKGAVLRSKGTTDEEVPMRLIGADAGVVVATWTMSAVVEAFRTCPWVEEDLRVAADKVLTLVGITIGPLGERLDASIREHIVSRLTMRPLVPGEVVVLAGETVPGLLLVGVGEIELVSGDAVTGVVGCGDFLFAGEVLGAGAAPATARAGTGGALVLFGDRSIAQELLVTCPPLVEVLAGM